jgi:hypothetical protein
MDDDLDRGRVARGNRTPGLSLNLHDLLDAPDESDVGEDRAPSIQLSHQLRLKRADYAIDECPLDIGPGVSDGSKVEVGEQQRERCAPPPPVAAPTAAPAQVAPPTQTAAPAPSPAPSVAPSFSGRYQVTETWVNGHIVTEMWNVVPCGTGCVNITPEAGGDTVRAMLHGDTWAFGHSIADDSCPGSHGGAAFLISADTLSGTVTKSFGAVCGNASEEDVDKISLTKIG